MIGARCACTLFKPQPMMTSNGSTHRLICVLEPTAMPSDRSHLFLAAAMMDDACSAALPTMGMTMVERNTPVMCDDWRRKEIRM